MSSHACVSKKHRETRRDVTEVARYQYQTLTHPRPSRETPARLSDSSDPVGREARGLSARVFAD